MSDMYPARLTVPRPQGKTSTHQGLSAIFNWQLMSTTGCLMTAEDSLDANTDKGKLFPTPAKDNILDTGSEH